MEIYEQAQQRLKMVDDGIKTKEILAYLTTAAERAAGRGSVSSILLLDKEGLVRNGASTRLPDTP